MANILPDTSTKKASRQMQMMCRRKGGFVSSL